MRRRLLSNTSILGRVLLLGGMFLASSQLGQAQQPDAKAGQGKLKDVALPNLSKALWQRALLLDNDEGIADEKGSDAKIWLDKALNELKDGPVVPGHTPLVFDDVVVYGSYYDVRAVYIRDAKNDKGVVGFKAGCFAWKSFDFEGALANCLSEGRTRITLSKWLSRYSKTSRLTSILFENSLTGSFSSDQRNVYVVDDLAVPAPVDVFAQHIWNSGQVGQDVKTLVLQNTLYAFNARVGNCQWRLGGGGKDDPFTESHFLGPPLSVGGKLYVLNEKHLGLSADSLLRLVCIDPLKLGGPGTPSVLAPIQSLGAVKQKQRITCDVRRRLSAVNLAYAQGILVCPTHAGVVYGVDPRNQRLIWTYSYQKASPPADPKKASKPPLWPVTYWKACRPFVHGGMLVFTAPDDASIHCLNLADGKLVWKAQHQEDIYLAGVFDDKVLLVGKAGCRALNLNDGKQAWALATGIPSGIGTAYRAMYMLPLKKGNPSGRPEVCVIDVAQGKIAGRTESRDGRMPGNLLVHGNLMFSQTVATLTAYPLSREPTE